jgi:hypothetical protein
VAPTSEVDADIAMTSYVELIPSAKVAVVVVMPTTEESQGAVLIPL